MSIPASQIVRVNPRLLKPGGNDLEFNGLLISENDTIPTTQLVLPFPDEESVGAYFGLESPEYAAARVYFLGYNNSFKKPRALYFGRRFAEDAPAYIRGGALPGTPAQSLEALQAITAGDLTLRLGAHTGTLTGIDFSGATSLSEVGLALQEAIQAETAGGAAWTGATVVYSSLFDAYTITAGASGADVFVGFGEGTVADALLLTEETGAVLSQGMDAMTETENMEAFLEVTRNFVCFTSISRLDADATLRYSQWASGKGVDYLYVFWDDSPMLLQPNNTATIAAALKDENAGSTAGVYDSLLYAAMIMGTAASIDWERRNGTITFAFKSLDGLPANVQRGVDAVNLTAQGMNFMGDYATRNDQFIFMYPGQMFGSWKWIDAYINAIWLNNSLQVALMAGLSQSSRTPYTEAGYTMIRAWCMDPIIRALRNGVIEPGVTLSELQKAQLFREAGRDISGELFTEGYVLQVEDASPATRQQRESPSCSLWYTYGGAVHRLELASTAVV